jgi:hypothetical protein
LTRSRTVGKSNKNRRTTERFKKISTAPLTFNKGKQETGA